MRYSVEPRDRMFVKGYEFLSFAKNMSKNTDKNTSENLSGKCHQNLPDHAKQSAIDALKTASKTANQTKKKTEATGGLTSSNNANKTTKISPQNNSATD